MAQNQSPIVDRIRIIPRPDDFLDRNVGSSGEIYFDSVANTLRLYSGRQTGGFTVLTTGNLTNKITDSKIATVEYDVTVGVDPDGIEVGNKYFLNGVYKPELTMVIGYTYIFNQNDQTNEYFPNPEGGDNNQHPLNFSSDNADGELGGGSAYTNNVIYKLNGLAVTRSEYYEDFASASTRSVQITITNDTPQTLYYWCQQHTGMGNTISVAEPGTGGGSGSIEVTDTAPNSPTHGDIWFNSTNAKLYVYIQDVDSSQWVQPSYPTPTALTDLGITDGTVGQILTTDGAGNFTFQDQTSVGNFTLSNSVVTTDDSSGISFVPSVTMNSDLTVENNLTVSNNISAVNFTSTGTGVATIDSATTITLSAPDGTLISSGTLRLANLTTTQRNALTPQNGDLIYNTTDNKLQGYQNSAWINLDDGSAA